MGTSTGIPLLPVSPGDMSARRVDALAIIVVVLLLSSSVAFGSPALPIATSYPYPRVNDGSSSALTHDGTNLVFLTQRPFADPLQFLEPLTGVEVRRLDDHAGGQTIGSMAWDGSYIHAGRVTTGRSTIVTLDPVTGDLVNSIPVPVIDPSVDRVEGLCYDGDSLFASLTDGFTPSGYILELDPNTGARRSYFESPRAYYGLTWLGGDTLLGADRFNGELVAFDKFDGAIRDTFQAPGSGEIHGLAFDGSRLYIADQGSQTIFVTIPEPSTLVLLSLAVGSLLVYALRKRF